MVGNPARHVTSEHLRPRFLTPSISHISDTVLDEYSEEAE